MSCCPPESMKIDGAPGTCRRRKCCRALFQRLVEIWRSLVSLSLANYATTKTSQSSIGRKHPPYRHETAGEEADTWLPSPLSPRRSCGDENVQRQRVWRKTSLAARSPEIQAVDVAPFAAEKVSGWI